MARLRDRSEADSFQIGKMIVKFDFDSVRSTTWGEYATRFIFGGAVTLFAGLIADKFGPGVGGLFLAFPAIFPASASLIEKHQREKKRRAGGNGEQRGRLAAGVDAAGATMGCVGLIGFGAIAWKVLPRAPLWESLLISTVTWAILAISGWIICRRLR
jgi:hypothetical protein